MQQTTTVERPLITLAELEVLEAKHTSALAPVPPAPMERPKVTARDARHQILGGIKIIARICGVDMTQDIRPAEMLVQRIDELEEEAAKREAYIKQLIAEHEAEKSHYRKALSAVSKVLDLYGGDPFEMKPISKWGKADLGKWMIAAGESIKWVMQRAENALDPDPDHVVPIAPDPE